MIICYYITYYSGHMNGYVFVLCLVFKVCMILAMSGGLKLLNISIVTGHKILPMGGYVIIPHVPQHVGDVNS